MTRTKRKRIGRDWRATGELAMFKEILAERSNVSEISGAVIYEPTVCNFMHLIPKSHYRRFRLRKDNIVIATASEHMMYDAGELSKLKADSKWDWIFLKAQELKEEYHRLPKTRT